MTYQPQPPLPAPPWYFNAIFYELYVRAFYDANGDGQGDLAGVIARLDYIKELGVDCIWLLPICDSPLVDDGYDVRDYRKLLPEYGTIDDLKRLVNAAHRRGLRIIADLVLNHSSDQHEWFVQSRRSRDNPYRDWYVWSDDPNKYKDAGIVFKDTQTSNWAWDEGSQQYYWHRFYPQQPDLNYDNPAVQQAMLYIAAYWLDLGVDGFRLDAIPYLYEREGTKCEGLPETHAYLKRLRQFVNQRNPAAVLLGEANQPPIPSLDYFGNGDELQMLFNFPQMTATFFALAIENAAPLYRILREIENLPPGAQWCTMLRNHDELTFEMVSVAEREFLFNYYAPDPKQRINWGVRRRLAPLLDNDPRRILLAYSTLFTLPGSPIIYYGDEIGMGDNISLPDRNGVRTPMQWDNGLNAGFSTADPARLYAPVVAAPPYDPTHVNVAAQQAGPDSLYHRLRQLIAVRKAHPAFGLGRFELHQTDNPAILAHSREWQGERIIALHNLSSQPQPFVIPTAFAALPATDLLTGVEYAEMRQITQLEPYQYLWLNTFASYLRDARCEG
ncbi:MAG: maltose alpha-D-glucosyltransferase [Candidatus Chloroheliales bacterium]|nr:MAG: maltose alpha-D-glucosyltransferase [Chloroflexota bacterium]